MIGLRSGWRKFRRDEKGSIILVTAPMMVALVGMAALSIDVMHAVTTKEHMRTAAEAAATAAVAKLPDQAAARDAAVEYAERNSRGANRDLVVTAEDVQLGDWDSDTKQFTIDAVSPTAARVVAGRTQEGGNPLTTLVGKVLGVASLDVEVAVVAARPEGQPCITALDPSGTKAISLDSNATIETSSCGIDVHSTASNALYTASNSEVSVTAAEICVQGGYQSNSNSSISPTPDTGCTPQPDPFAKVAPPPIGACTETNFNKNDRTQPVQPGTYCGGLTLGGNSNVTFAPGIYVIKDGKLKLDSNTRATGNGVAFYFTGAGATIEFNSNTQVSFKAPTSGPMAGLLFFQDRNFGTGMTHKFDSNTMAVLDGAIYFPKATFSANSNTQMGASSTCLMLVAFRLQFNSNSGIDTTPDYSTCAIPPNVRRTRIVS